MISVENLSVSIDRELLLPPISLRVAAGAAPTLTGPNGSGKTTLLRVLAGLQQPTTGSAHTVFSAQPSDDAL